MSIDPSTGMPEVPEGHFWRIKKHTAEYMVVQLRKRVLFWSVVVEDWTVNKAKASAGEILTAANFALRHLAQKRDTTDSWKQYIGDYPPLTLQQEAGK